MEESGEKNIKQKQRVVHEDKTSSKNSESGQQRQKSAAVTARWESKDEEE